MRGRYEKRVVLRKFSLSLSLSLSLDSAAAGSTNSAWFSLTEVASVLPSARSNGLRTSLESMFTEAMSFTTTPIRSLSVAAYTHARSFERKNPRSLRATDFKRGPQLALRAERMDAALQDRLEHVLQQRRLPGALRRVSNVFLPTRSLAFLSKSCESNGAPSGSES